MKEKWHCSVGWHGVGGGGLLSLQKRLGMLSLQKAISTKKIQDNTHHRPISGPPLGTSGPTVCYEVLIIGIDHDTVCAGVVVTAIRNSTSCAGRRVAAPAGTTSALRIAVPTTTAQTV